MPAGNFRLFPNMILRQGAKRGKIFVSRRLSVFFPFFFLWDIFLIPSGGPAALPGPARPGPVLPLPPRLLSGVPCTPLSWLVPFLRPRRWLIDAMPMYLWLVAQYLEKIQLQPFTWKHAAHASQSAPSARRCPITMPIKHFCRKRQKLFQ